MNYAKHPGVDMKLSEAIESYLALGQLNRSTSQQYQKNLEYFLTYIGDLEISDIFIEDINRYRQTICGRSTCAIYKLLRPIKSLFKWIKINYDIDCLDDNRIIIKKYYSQQIGYFTDEEMAKLRKCLQTYRDRAIFELMYSTGLRRNEVRSIKIEDVDFINNTIEICGKGNKPARVYLTEKAKKILQEYLSNRANSEYLISTYHGDQISSKLIYKCFYEWGKRAGLKHCSPHMLRKTFVTKLYDEGADLNTVRRLARHECLNTTQKYIMSSDKKDKSVHDVCMGNNRRFEILEKKNGFMIFKCDVYCGKSININRARSAIKAVVDKLCI